MTSQPGDSGHSAATAGPLRDTLAPKSVFDEAIALINGGDLAGAEARCRAALAAHPRDVNMQALLGAVLIKLERHAEAESMLAEAIALAPTFAKPHEDLGRLLFQQQRTSAAVVQLERAVHLDPTLESAWFTLGKARAALGRGSDAD
jgi:Flp pilus assembly protein TadD